ncbi:unnamed protein product [Vicia faba]|uniref:Uncharacterized protein n=1 Tax=Vicia faba TaxID=3906 RepID=A0AAV0YTA1_VICFA|nr:unnamed protein product [Vicia faba]
MHNIQFSSSITKLLFGRVSVLHKNPKRLDCDRFCYMEPFKGQCADAEQKVKPGIVTVSTKRSGYDSTLKDSSSIKVEAVSDASNTDGKLPNSENAKRPALKRLKRGPSRYEESKSKKR